jgi:hypothetical protein
MMKTIRMICVLLLLSGASALAQQVELYGGYGFQRLNSSSRSGVNLNGWAVGTQLDLPHVTGLSLATDFSGAYGKQSGASLHQYTYAGGPRLSQKLGRVKLFEHCMLGYAQLNARLASQTDGASSFALVLGGGADLSLAKHFSIRLSQADYLRTGYSSNTQNSFKYSTGAVWRF